MGGARPVVLTEGLAEADVAVRPPPRRGMIHFHCP
jgi:hypothetical protein